jgi:hypothetical protein
MPVTKQPRNSIRGSFIAAGLFVGLQLAACASKPPQQPASPDPAAANDAKIVERTEKMRARALAAPGGAIEASDFASHVTMLFTQGVSKRRPVPPALVDEAVQCLDQAKEAKPDDAPDLLVRKGELLLAAGKSEPARAPCASPLRFAPRCAPSRRWRNSTRPRSSRPSSRPCARKPCRP